MRHYHLPVWLNGERLLIALPALFALLTLLYTVARHVVVEVGGDEGGFDFRYFYILASMLRDGIDYAQLSPESFTRLADGYMQGMRYPAGSPYVVYHTPTWILAVVPFTWLSPVAAAGLWGLCATALYAAGIVLLLRVLMETLELKLPQAWPLLCSAVFLAGVYYPFILGLHTGQVDSLIFFLLALSMLHLLRGRWLLSGLFAGMMCWVKPAAVFILPFWLLRRHSALGVAIAGTVAFTIILLLPGSDFLAHYFRRLLETSDFFFQHVLLSGDEGNMSLLGFIARVFGTGGESVYRLLMFGSNIASLLLTAWLARGVFDDAASGMLRASRLALAVCVWLLLLPQVEVTYMVLAWVALMPLLFLLPELPRPQALAVVVSTLLLGLAYSVDRFAIFQYGWPSFLKSAQLWALALLVIVLAKSGHLLAAESPRRE